jgi:hypothetical protein
MEDRPRARTWNLIAANPRPASFARHAKKASLRRTNVDNRKRLPTRVGGALCARLPCYSDGRLKYDSSASILSIRLLPKSACAYHRSNCELLAQDARVSSDPAKVCNPDLGLPALTKAAEIVFTKRALTFLRDIADQSAEIMALSPKDSSSAGKGQRHFLRYAISASARRSPPHQVCVGCNRPVVKSSVEPHFGEALTDLAGLVSTECHFHPAYLSPVWRKCV